MKRSSTPWRTHSAAGLTALLLVLPACVTRGTHEQVVAERDRLTEERNALQVRADRLETSQRVLEDERVDLLEEIEGLRQTRGALETEVQRAQRELDRTGRQLQDTEGVLTAQRQAHAEAVASANSELARLRTSYDALVGDLESEVETGRVELERLRDGTGFSLPDDVVFAPGSARPTVEGRRLIGSLAARLVNVVQLIEVHGHTDSVPTQGALAERYPSNWELAGARAASVVRILIEGGVPAERLVAVSHGPSLPIAPNDTLEGRARNRRIEIQLRPLPAPGSAGAPVPAAP